MPAAALIAREILPWAACKDIVPDFSGLRWGLMNMLGNLGGWHSPIATAAIFLHVGWNMAFNFAGLMMLMSGVLCLAVKTEDKLA